MVLDLLKKDINEFTDTKYFRTADYYQYLGYREHYLDSPVIAKAHSIAALFTGYPKNVYKNDLVLGSICGIYSKNRDEFSEAKLKHASEIVANYGKNTFRTNADHYAADFETILNVGIDGLFAMLDHSKTVHREEPERVEFIEAMEITLRGFSKMAEQYADAAEAVGNTEAAAVCRRIAHSKPESFREAIQIMWLMHIAFLCEGRGAMAFGRMDQYLYPFYEKDIESGNITREDALELVQCTLYKIHESYIYGNSRGSDTVNIAIGGVKRDGSDAVNALTYVILEAVRNCNIPGPNLSARVSVKNPDEFLLACIDVIGTGIGYPALMNDEINVKCLERYGYDIEDCRDYCMVGCIENFLQGKQPPWSDGGLNPMKTLVLTLHNGVSPMTGVLEGIESGDVSTFETMDDFIAAFEKQTQFLYAESTAMLNNDIDRFNTRRYTQPFLSIFCRCCIERGLDVREGGALYKSAHGLSGAHVATFADSLYAIEEMVFNRKAITFAELKKALDADFVGYEELQRVLLELPKYGNDIPEVDKYAKLYIDVLDRAVYGKRTRDGGWFYISSAGNTWNIARGAELGATPDGRNAGKPIAETTAPMHGFDRSGQLAVLKSVTNIDFTKTATGAVLNQKYSPEMFKNEENKQRLCALLRTYFALGGQEMQINSISKELLSEAMDNPDGYRTLVTRVAGFSAYYTTLSRAVQNDILERTEY